MSLKRKSTNGVKEFKILWTKSAIENLQEIFDYYKSKANLDIASDIVNRIVDKSILLQFQPRMGQVEELLKNRTKEYRYLTESNYKIIYWIEDLNITISTVFDCRQNPNKIQNIN